MLVPVLTTLQNSLLLSRSTSTLFRCMKAEILLSIYSRLLKQKQNKQKQVAENMSILFLSDSFLGIIMLATKQSHLVKYTPLVLYTQIISSCKRPFISKQKPCNNSGIMR